MLILYAYDTNENLVEPIKTRSDADMLRAYDVLYDTIKIVVQLAPTHSHRINSAELAIRTSKNNFVTGLAPVDNNFPMYLFFRIVKQSEISINLLRTPRTNPRLSAYAQILGKFYFIETPMAPPGTRIIAHEKPVQRETWSRHGVVGWYIGPVLEPYRCYKVFVT